MLKSWSRAREDRARGQSRLSRLHLGLPADAGRLGRGAGRGDARQEDAADRPRRDQHHRGGPVALARVQPEGARLPQPAGGVPAAGVRRRQMPQAGMGRARASRSSGRSIPTSPTRTSISAIRWSVASARRRSRCAARSSWRYNLDEEIRVIRKNQAVPVEMPIPAGRRRPRSRRTAASIATIPALANKLLDYFNYERGKDGYRTLPDGKPLTLKYAAGIVGDRPRVQRAVEEVDGRDRHPDRVPGDEVRRPRQGGQGLPADDGRSRVECRLSGRRQLHAAPLRSELRPEQQRLLRVEGVRRVLREVDADARFARAQPALSRDDAADGSRRRVEPARLARAQPDSLAVGAGLQEASDPPRRIRLHGHRAAR